MHSDRKSILADRNFKYHLIVTEVMKKTVHAIETSFLSFSIMMFLFIQLNSAFAFEFATSPNPVGSGARAMGMGGAFIAVADDATAASWNPGGLVQLKTPEMSVVGNWFHKTEDNDFGHHPEACGTERVSEADLNYLSVVYPFSLFNRNMVVSLNYQKLYDFTREWDFRFTECSVDAPLPGYSVMTIHDRKWHYEQSGGLSALGIAYCIQIIPQLSLGLTLNIWDDDLTHSEWEENIHGTSITSQTLFLWGSPTPSISEEPESYEEKNKYLFDGFNTNIGILWRPADELTIGLVFKTPFTADIKYEHQIRGSGADSKPPTPSCTEKHKLDMPMSYGIGLSYRISGDFRVSADVYRTEWEDYIYTDSKGKETSPITGKSEHESDIDPTHQVRIGMEYLFVDQKSHYVIPFRAGVFYDPVPAQGSPDDYYGFSLGSGFGLGRWVIDIAYQYRFGNDIGASLNPTPELDFSQDVKEHMVYSSLIFHF